MKNTGFLFLYWPSLFKFRKTIWSHIDSQWHDFYTYLPLP